MASQHRADRLILPHWHESSTSSLQAPAALGSSRGTNAAEHAPRWHSCLQRWAQCGNCLLHGRPQLPPGTTSQAAGVLVPEGVSLPLLPPLPLLLGNVPVPTTCDESPVKTARASLWAAAWTHSPGRISHPRATLSAVHAIEAAVESRHCAAAPLISSSTWLWLKLESSCASAPEFKMYFDRESCDTSLRDNMRTSGPTYVHGSPSAKEDEDEDVDGSRSIPSADRIRRLRLLFSFTASAVGVGAALTEAARTADARAAVVSWLHGIFTLEAPQAHRDDSGTGHSRHLPGWHLPLEVLLQGCKHALGWSHGNVH